MTAKKIVVVGKGTAGTQAVAHMERWFPDAQIDWMFNPNIPTKSVGEGSVLTLPRALANNIGFMHTDLPAVDGSFKVGIYKENWGTGDPFFHNFKPPMVAYHFSATKLQDYIEAHYRKSKRVNVVEVEDFDVDSIDADYIISCAGKPKDFTTFSKIEVAVNSVFVSQCAWERSEFDYTLTIARPYGWVFGIPLQSRCSIGYLFNRNITSLEEVQEDVKEVLSKYKLQVTRTNYLEFDSYLKKENFSSRVAFNGDASFFIEPLEATSTWTMDEVNRWAFDIINKNKSEQQCNGEYLEKMGEIYAMIMMHYAAGSPFKTKFWDYAQDLGQRVFGDALRYNRNFQKILTEALIQPDYRLLNDDGSEFGTWWRGSFQENLKGLGLQEKVIRTLGLTL